MDFKALAISKLVYLALLTIISNQINSEVASLQKSWFIP